MTPESIAKELGVEYIGCHDIFWTVPPQKQYLFNDPITKSTIAVYELSELESKLKKSRKKFKVEA